MGAVKPHFRDANIFTTTYMYQYLNNRVITIDNNEMNNRCSRYFDTNFIVNEIKE